MTAIPADYLDRVYAGVLGKLIGVYLGRPFENWTYQRIMAQLGEIDGYVNARLGQPLVVTDDDVSGTFTFVRALEDHGVTESLSAAEIGETWLNYLIENRSILWWGGNGNSTEHTAWLNLKRGMAAPASGSIATNGQVIAEQIGAQIFIDGWGMVAPNRPPLAARLAGEAARVSHDGEAVHAAQLWAAMEAAAFGTYHIEALIDIGLAQIPEDCLIAKLVADIRAWRDSNADWRETRALIEANYGYNRYGGNCHVVPNHALMLMAVLYAPTDFRRAMTIVNTSGWDTDCNAGNVGCFLGILNGLAAFDGGIDWRGPIADRMLISSADGGNSITDAVRQTYYLAGLGHQLAVEAGPLAPKDGAQFHFALPGSRQGFRAYPPSAVRIGSGTHNGAHALAIAFDALGRGETVAVTTPTFAPSEVLEMRTYELMASPLLYPGQTLGARIAARADNAAPIYVAFRLRVFGDHDRLEDVDGPASRLEPGETMDIAWRVPETGGRPIGEVGLAMSCASATGGCLVLDSLRWDGAPEVTFRRPSVESDFWRRAWVNSADVFSTSAPQSFRIAQSHGEGLIAIGTRQWADYRVRTDIISHLGDYFGVAVRVQGLRRYYAVRVMRSGDLQIARVRDGRAEVLAAGKTDFSWDAPLTFDITVRDRTVAATVGGVVLTGTDTSPSPLIGGGVGILAHEGAISADMIEVTSASQRLPTAST